MTGVLIISKEDETQTQREDSHVTVEVETLVTWWKTTDYQKLPKVGRGEERFFAKGFRGSMALSVS